MPNLTIEQRATRATTRRNRKVAKEYPLFAEQFAVTVESQVERLQRQEKEQRKHLDKLDRWEVQEYEKAMQLREICKANMPAEKFSECDAMAYRIYGTRGKWSLPEHSGAFYADWWWQYIRDYVPSYAQAHCPNSQFHDWDLYQQEGKCPTCLKPLTCVSKTENSVPVQLSFIRS